MQIFYPYRVMHNFLFLQCRLHIPTSLYRRRAMYGKLMQKLKNFLIQVIEANISSESNFIVGTQCDVIRIIFYSVFLLKPLLWSNYEKNRHIIIEKHSAKYLTHSSHNCQCYKIQGKFETLSNTRVALKMWQLNVIECLG